MSYITSFFYFYTYLLQLENYNLVRFMRAAAPHVSGAPRETRKEVVWTHKLRAVFALAVALQALLSMLVGLLLPLPSLLWGIVVAVCLFVLLSSVFFVFLACSVVVFLPLDMYLKQARVTRAKEKLAAHRHHMKVIGITGSYGKTTMKEALVCGLSGAHNVAATRENLNTPLGIASQIMNEISESTDIFIVEMGAYERGDIRELVEFVDPDIVVLTGINEAHLDRQGSMENIIMTKFEIVSHASEGAMVVLNADDERVVSHAPRFLKEGQDVHWYTSGTHECASYRVENTALAHDGLAMEFDIVGKETRLHMKLAVLGEYIRGVAMAVYIVGEAMSLRGAQINAGLSRLAPVPHRLQPVQLDSDVLLIDDGYNGNPAGAEEAIRVLGRFSNRRKIYVTPGLVEMGEESERVHQEIAHKLFDVADIVVLIDTPGARVIHRELLRIGFRQDALTLCASMKDVQEKLRTIKRAGDVVLIQNDVTENYQL